MAKRKGKVKEEEVEISKRKHSRTAVDVLLNDIKLVENPRVHPEREIEGIIESIQKYGFMNPVHLSREDNTLIEGYARYEACKRLELKTIPVLHMDLKPSEYYIVMILGNRLAELGTWNYPLFIRLTEDMLDEKREPMPELGFSGEEIANIRRWQEDEGGVPPFEVSDFIDTPPTTPVPEIVKEQQEKKVEIVLSCPLVVWEKNRVEMESDLVSLCTKFEGLRFSPPRMKTVPKTEARKAVDRRKLTK